MIEKIVNANTLKVITKNPTDFVRDGRVTKDAYAPSVLIVGQGDLSGLDGYPPGTVAYTAGFVKMWQLSASGSWVSII